MIKGVDLMKILDEDFGDAGFNDDVPEIAESKAVAPKKRNVDKSVAAAGAQLVPSCVAPSTSSQIQPLPHAPKSDAKPKAPKPFERGAVLGAPPPPPEGANAEQAAMAALADENARKQGYKDAQEYSRYLLESGALGQPDLDAAEEAQQLAPGIKKPPSWATPGAYPGDKTKLGKEYERELREREERGETVVEPPKDLGQQFWKHTYVKQAEKHGQRPSEGQTITFRMALGGEEQSAEVGGTTLPWALDIMAKKMKLGDVVEVVATDEYAFADAEEVRAGEERRFLFELLSITGPSKDKFKLGADERIDRANELRLRGNELFKKGRFRRAMDLYERGSSYMDLLEAEDLGMPGAKADPIAAERNRRIWACNQPLLLNWTLILMRFGYWREAERKCTEVLMDIDKLCVKALFRRGVCNLNLGNLDQARLDLRRAGELDTSVGPEVARALVKVDALQRVLDKADVPIAKKLVGGYLQVGDDRSVAPPPVSAPPAKPGAIDLLREHEAAAREKGIDEDSETFRLQRQALYDQLLSQR